MIRTLPALDDARTVTLIAVVIVSAVLWWPMFSMGDMDMSFGGGTPRWTVGIVVGTSVMWILMMLAMMLPAMAPVLGAYARLSARESGGVSLAGRVIAFGCGYFALWAVASVALAIAQLGLRHSSYFVMDGTMATPVAAGALMLIAGLYQFTSVKDACLTHCRSPMTFLMAHWRDGAGGALRMGLHHGAFCVGCCIAFMGLMFIFGAMNPYWMAVIAAFFLAEKILPAAEIWGRIIGGLLALAGGAILIMTFLGGTNGG